MPTDITSLSDEDEEEKLKRKRKLPDDSKDNQDSEDSDEKPLVVADTKPRSHAKPKGKAKGKAKAKSRAKGKAQPKAKGSPEEVEPTETGDEEAAAPVPAKPKRPTKKETVRKGRQGKKTMPEADGEEQPPEEVEPEEIQDAEESAPVQGATKRSEATRKRPAASTSVMKRPSAGPTTTRVGGVEVKDPKFHPDGRLRVTKGFYARDGVHGIKIGKTEVLRAPLPESLVVFIFDFLPECLWLHVVL